MSKSNLGGIESGDSPRVSKLSKPMSRDAARELLAANRKKLRVLFYLFPADKLRPLVAKGLECEELSEEEKADFMAVLKLPAVTTFLKKIEESTSSGPEVEDADAERLKKYVGAVISCYVRWWVGTAVRVGSLGNLDGSLAKSIQEHGGALGQLRRSLPLVDLDGDALKPLFVEFEGAVRALVDSSEDGVAVSSKSRIVKEGDEYVVRGV